MPESTADSTASGPTPIWRTWPARFTLAAIPAWFTLAILLFATPWRIKAIVGLVAAITLVSPAHGLLAVAAVAPIAELLAMLMRVEQFRLSEIVVLSFLTAWILRPWEDGRGPRMPRAMAMAGWLLAGVVVVSLAVGAWQLTAFPGELSAATDRVVHAYYLGIDNIGLADSARLLEGLGLVAATIIVFRKRPLVAVTLPAALTLSATVAAISSELLRRRIGPAMSLAWVARIGSRVSGHIPDVNAAGSYFAMALCLAAGMAIRAATTQTVPGRRLPRAFAVASRLLVACVWLAGAAFSGRGLWLSGSRSAMGILALVSTLVVVWVLTSTWRLALRAGLIGAFLLAMLSAGAINGRVVQKGDQDDAIGFRREFNATSLRMVAEHPFFGVGIGQYFQSSALFLPPRLGWFYGSENAHNFFLQVAAELGIPGLALFAAWLAIGLAIAAAALARSPIDPRLLGITAGVVTFMGTCLIGHPLLVDEVAYPFWMLFGLGVALSGSILLNMRENMRERVPGSAPTEAVAIERISGRALPLAIAGVAGFLLMGGVSRARWPIEPPALQAVDGFYDWETAGDGSRFRWSELYASVFVPADVTRVYMPVRLPGDVPALTPMGVEVRIGGVRHGRTLVGNSWAVLNLELPDVGPPARYKRIDLKVDRTWQPALFIAGSADLRAVGIQVGECRLFREH
jgi:O-antigen ligase